MGDRSTTQEEEMSGAVVIDLVRGSANPVKNARSESETKGLADLVDRLRSKICSLQMTVAELQSENHDLKRQLMTVRDLRTARKQLRYEQSVYWKYDESGNRVGGPFCPNCLDEDHIRPLMPGAANGLYRCEHHKALFASGPIGAGVWAVGA